MAFGIIVMSLMYVDPLPRPAHLLKPSLASAGGAIWATAAFDKLSPDDKVSLRRRTYASPPPSSTLQRPLVYKG